MLAEPVAVHAQQGHVECRGGPLDTPAFLTTQLGPPGSSNASAAAKTRPPAADLPGRRSIAASRLGRARQQAWQSKT